MAYYDKIIIYPNQTVDYLIQITDVADSNDLAIEGHRFRLLNVCCRNPPDTAVLRTVSECH